MIKQMQLLGCMLALSLTSPLAVQAAPVAAQPESRHEDLIYKVSCLSKIGRCAFPAFSPDGKTVAFVAEMSGTPQLWTVPIEGGWPIRSRTSVTQSLVKNGPRKQIGYHCSCNPVASTGPFTWSAQMD